MGLLIGKKAQATTIAKDAKRAIEEGRHLFVARIRTAGVSSNYAASSVPGWAEAVESIEAEGWALTHWSVEFAKDDPWLYAMFRRTADAPIVVTDDDTIAS